MKNQKGFTVLELLVVVAMIALLSTLAIVALNQAKLKQECREGDYKACQTLKDREIEVTTKKEEESRTTKVSRCREEENKCDYDCAMDKDNDLDECMKRCGIKNSYCKSK